MTAPLVTLTQNDWSLHRKGPIDQSRHNEKVKEAIKGNLPSVIGEEAIITSYEYLSQAVDGTAGTHVLANREVSTTRTRLQTKQPVGGR